MDCVARMTRSEVVWQRAMQLAARIGRPAVLLTGDDSLTAGHLVGREIGMKSRQVVDRYVHSVHKVETETTSTWSDAVLTQAVVDGLTFVYDEFTRSPPRQPRAR